ncbi:MAG: lipid A deacylase LpxR family protein [Desulforhopalus sp.]
MYLRNIFVFFICGAVWPFTAAAQTEKQLVPGDKTTVIFYLENDLFGGTDRHYTNAVKFSWLSRDLKKFSDDHQLPGLARWIVDKTAAVDQEDFLHNIAFSMGQNIYTPQDIDESALISDDRPYAGWTYFSAALHSRNTSLLNTFEISLGMVGPASLAEDSQKFFHENLGLSEDPQGWDNQLADELGLMLTWQRFWRVIRESSDSGFAYDIIPHAGLTAGNVFTYANLGGELRFGYNLPMDFGTSLIRPGGGTSAPVSMGDPRLGSGGNIGLTFFVGADGRAIARNIFLDGNTWQDSHSVDKNYLVADISSGVSLAYKKMKLTYTHVYRSEEFDGQDGGHLFGSLTLSYTF